MCSFAVGEQRNGREKERERASKRESRMQGLEIGKRRRPEERSPSISRCEASLSASRRARSRAKRWTANAPGDGTGRRWKTRDELRRVNEREVRIAAEKKKKLGSVLRHKLVAESAPFSHPSLSVFSLLRHPLLPPVPLCLHLQRTRQTPSTTICQQNETKRPPYPETREGETVISDI